MAQGCGAADVLLQASANRESHLQDIFPGVKLEDWVTSLLTIALFQSLNLGSGKVPPFLAYLSACRTGSNAGSKLLDESINLVSACYLAGFSHVIGTLWAAKGATRLDVADRVYKNLGDKGLTEEAVNEGLHWGVRELRDGFSLTNTHPGGNFSRIDLVLVARIMSQLRRAA